MKRILAMLLCVTLVVSVFAGCSKKEAGAAGAGDTIKIGVFEPLTGANAAGGELEVDGMKIANELYPEVLGKKIELVIVDNKSDKAEATTAVARLIEKEKVSVILGSWGSGFSIAAGDLVKTNKVPAIGASCTNPMVTQGNDYYFRVCFLDPFQGTVMANYASKSLGAKKAAIIQEVSNDYSVGLASFFVNAFKKLTGDENCIVASANYNTGDQDFNSQLTTVLAANPDVIFAPGNFTESAMIIKQARKLGSKVPIIGGDTWETNEFIEVGGADVEGTVLSTFFDDTNPLTNEANKFLDAYKAKNPDKNVAAVTALGYDAYLMAYKAIEAAGSADPVKIRDAIAATKDLEGVTGIINLTSEGDADKDTAVIKVVKDGKFTFQENMKVDK
ncbi:amino acid/amide ABC transporter substrate-binding protein (HAAT family) [Hydrogenoanaerobacterium saccharovorans]|uniref:Amino acid/amide ABC transporter substrate-binding protein, HAAT family n=1 Tax=Hydrogenoanaerobacterium saccharovorans TaxID=474960 RepID=A0A1H7ZLR6_9FIRM|nr:ABC transporter substrate-binding protein [Hydrogenoanaerobacterium saccharovorans]RPF48522.1 amino acid/amide ABC transporter substrate-binding protein (HAAT family) [Hydrogenoanaerobacterium saccharovorans]SEM59191.1 amino acid/amide ABC transporter substrate-binding protein, HAAT family [Hydrogenoanaerobacterium saccharovorans]